MPLLPGAINQPDVSVDCLTMSAKAPAAARLVAAGLMLAGWGASAAVAAADPTPEPSPAVVGVAVTCGLAVACAPGRAGEDHHGPRRNLRRRNRRRAGYLQFPGPVGSGTCYWKRMANPDGALIDNAISKKPQVVQIDAGDKAFKTSGCQPWQLTPDAALPSQASNGQVQGTLGILGSLLGGAQQAPQPTQQAPAPSSQGPAPGPAPGQQAPQS